MLQPDWRRPRSRQRDASVRALRNFVESGPHRRFFCEQLRVIAGRHGCRFRDAVAHPLDHALAIPLHVLRIRPFHFVRSDVDRPRDEFFVKSGFQCRDIIIVVAADDFDARLLQSRGQRCERLARCRIDFQPASGVQMYQTPRLHRCGQFGARTVEQRLPRAADGKCQMRRGAPGIGQRCTQHAEVIVRRRNGMHPGHRQCAMRGLEPDHAAIRGGPQSRALGLRAERNRQHAGAHGRRRTARRAAGRALCIVRISCGAGPAARELCRHRLADDNGASIPQRLHARRVVARLPAGEQRAAHLRRHVAGIHDVLDTHRTAVHHRQGTACPIALSRKISRGARGIEIQRDERFHLGLACGQRFQALFEELPRRALAGHEFRDRARKADQLRHRNPVIPR